MRRPQSSTEKKDPKHHCASQSSSGALARMRRFITVSLGGRQSPPRPLSPLKRACDVLPATPSQALSTLLAEADAVLGRSLDELMRGEERDIPSFVHDLCCHMLTHGVDYEVLVCEDWCPERSQALLEGATEGVASAALFRLFLQRLPSPLLNKDAAAALSRVCKELESCDGGRDIELFQEMVTRSRSVLSRKVSAHSVRLLQYLASFLHQLRTANHNTCPVTPSALSRLLGRVLTERGMKEASDPTSFRLAEMLLLNHAVIFRDADQIGHETNYSSDSVSSNCDSRGDTADEADLFTPDDDDDDDEDCDDTSGQGMSGSQDVEDDSTTTTTTDTDDFRSPPVSPIKRGSEFTPAAPGTSSPARTRSTDELAEGEGFISKIAPYGKNYLPSITGLLTSPYESWSLDPFRPKEETSDDLFEPNAESSCVSGEEVSELESEGDRDADGSDTEGASKYGVPCPHEERRSSERFLLREHHSSGRKPKRRIRRKHSKDHGRRIQSSEEEDRYSTPTFATLMSTESAPAPFDPTPPDTAHHHQPFHALLSSVEPVTSERASWGLRQEDALIDNWQRTTPLYSREEEEKEEVLKPSWYLNEDDAPRTFRDPARIDALEDVRPRGGGHGAIKLLSKNVSAIKRKIKRFEEDFERNCGYRPSHSDKMKHKEVKKYMAELSKAKKELKQMKEDLPAEKKTPKPFPMSLLRCQESTTPAPPHAPAPAHQVTKDTYEQVEKCLSAKRSDADRPLKVAELTLDQLKEEKTDIQKALLFYESLHGRPSTREDKELVRPLYDRYRLVKRSVNKLNARSKESVIELAPILEHVVMDFTLASPQHRGSLQEDEEVGVPPPPPTMPGQGGEDPTTSPSPSPAYTNYPMNPDPHPEIVPSSAAGEVNLSDLHALPIHELKERKKEAREEKKRLRHSLREYEARFERETGRKMQKEDRGPMDKNYNEYKHVKAKLRLLEALLSKHDS